MAGKKEAVTQRSSKGEERMTKQDEHTTSITVTVPKYIANELPSIAAHFRSSTNDVAVTGIKAVVEAVNRAMGRERIQSGPHNFHYRLSIPNVETEEDMKLLLQLGSF